MSELRLPAMVLYERRRRRAEAERKAFTDAPPTLTVGAQLSIAKTLRRRRSLRYEAWVAESKRSAEARGGLMRPAASSLSTRADFGEKLAEHGLSGSEIGVEQVPAWSERGTVGVSNAIVTRTVTFSLEVFDQYKSNVEMWNYLVGLALVATLAPTTSVLRSGTTLIRQSRKVEMFADLQPVETIDETGLFEEVLIFAREAALKFGIGKAETLTVNIDAIIAEAKSGSENKKKVSAKKTKKLAEGCALP